MRIAARLTESGEAGGKSNPGIKSFNGPGKDPMTGARDASSSSRVLLSSIALEPFDVRELGPRPARDIGIGMLIVSTVKSYLNVFFPLPLSDPFFGSMNDKARLYLNNVGIE